MAERIQIRRDTANNWEITNPVLAQGEPAYEIDTKKFKVGNGINNYNDLPYASKGDKGEDGLPGKNAASGHITIIPHNYSSIGQGTWLWYPYSSHIMCGTFANLVNDDLGDNISYKIDLSPGTYSIAVLCSKRAQGAVVSFDLDGQEIFNFDTYYPTTINNFVEKKEGIVVTEPGLKTLTVTVIDKAQGSSHFRFLFQNIALWRTE